MTFIMAMTALTTMMTVVIVYTMRMVSSGTTVASCLIRGRIILTTNILLNLNMTVLSR